MDIWTEYQSDQPLPLEDARRRIAESIDWPLEKIRIESVRAYVYEMASAAGLQDYTTTWEFQARVSR